VHFVTEELDGGPSIIQGRLSVSAQDTAQTLNERVMREVELKIYPQAVAWMARGMLKLDAGHVRFRGARLAAPLTMDDLEMEFR
jgi:phosphoribosylglycinamide formyltransferase-1